MRVSNETQVNLQHPPVINRKYFVSCFRTMETTCHEQIKSGTRTNRERRELQSFGI